MSTLLHYKVLVIKQTVYVYICWSVGVCMCVCVHVGVRSGLHLFYHVDPRDRTCHQA